MALLSGSMSHCPNTRSTGQQVRRESRYRGDMVMGSIDNYSIGMFIVEIRINTSSRVQTSRQDDAHNSIKPGFRDHSQICNSI